MIIFDLDGTLADCTHRRHFVDRAYWYDWEGCGKRWKPNYNAFYEECDRDLPIEEVIRIFNLLSKTHEVQIWSGRCESVRPKTMSWLLLNTEISENPNTLINIKMRPIGDSTPDDVLKEKWLDEAISEGKKIDFVFDDRPKVVRMWHRRGIFVFNCLQGNREF